jgi:hypothetical protein
VSGNYTPDSENRSTLRLTMANCRRELSKILRLFNLVPVALLSAARQAQPNVHRENMLDLIRIERL